jgi:hypothetical protein
MDGTSDRIDLFVVFAHSRVDRPAALSNPQIGESSVLQLTGRMSERQADRVRAAKCDADGPRIDRAVRGAWQ